MGEMMFLTYRWNPREHHLIENFLDSEVSDGRANLTSQYDQEKMKDLDQIKSIPKPSIWRVIRLNKPEWPYGVMGSIGAILAGIESPLFAFVITHVLTAFYSRTELHIKHEIKMISIIFIGAAFVTVPMYLLQNYFYTLMGEKVIARARLLMFSVVLRNEIGWFDLEENNSGSLASSLASDATLVRSTITERMSIIIQNISLTVTAFIIGFLLSWRMTAVVFAIFSLLVGALIAEQLFLKGFGGNHTHAYDRSSSIARKAITNVRSCAMRS